MKKQSVKERQRIVHLNLLRRLKPASASKKSLPIKTNSNRVHSRKKIIGELKKFQSKGVEISFRSKNKRALEIWLPEIMNFSDQFELTTSYINTIRYCVEVVNESSSRFRLRSVRFDKLQRVSTSAALVLTSEISRWDDKVNNVLNPDLSKWNTEIIEQFNELGYFDLFPNANLDFTQTRTSKLRLIRYIKGRCGDNDKPRELKAGIHKLIGKDIQKWTFLHGGLSEAITNVSHHAYPSPSFDNFPKNWYLTASFNTENREMKISFYDQGIGIPATLPTSKLREYVAKYMRRVKPVKYDATMIRAALAYGRSRTGDDDRGKGLQDMLQFIREIGEGYLSIISSKGLCKVDYEGYHERKTKTESFENALPGTLIIWKVTIPTT